MTRRRGGLLAIGIGIMLLVAAGTVAGIWIWQTASRSPSAEETTRAYLQALTVGDADAVVSTGVSVSDDARAVFAGASAFIDDAAVVGVEERGGSATADVSFRMGDRDRTATLTLERRDGGWRLDSSALALLDVRMSTGSAVVIGEVAVSAEKPLALLPAVYDVAAAPSALLEGGTTAALLPGETTAVEIDVEVRAAATDAAQDVLDEHLETCTAEGDSASDGGATPEGCGIRIPWGVDFREVTDVAFRIETLPTVSLTPTAFTAGGGVLVATVDGTGHDGSARTITYRTESWTVRGDVAFTTKGIELTVW